MPDEVMASVSSEKSRILAIILAFWIGGFGAHKFYIGQKKKGLYFLVFFWTLIPYFIAWWNAIHYIIMGSDEFNQRVNGSYEKENSTLSQNSTADSEMTSPPSESENDDSDGELSIDVPDDAITAAEGRNGQVIVFKNKIRISRENISLLQRTQQWGKGNKEILMKNITSVQLREPSSFTVGYIQFGQEGYVQAGGSQFDAIDDENSVTFDKDELEQFKKVRDKVQELTSEDVETGGNAKDPIETLKQRYAEGEISEEEFEKKKEFLTNN